MASIYICGGVEESLCQRNRYSENERVDHCAQNSQRTLTRCRAMEGAEKGSLRVLRVQVLLAVPLSVGDMA